MDPYKIGVLIRSRRKALGMTQLQLALRLQVSDKAVSKWERGSGCPDSALLPAVAKTLDLQLETLMSGEVTQNDTIGGNMKRIAFHVCPACGNLVTSTGTASVACCGSPLEKLTAAPAEAEHLLTLEAVEDETLVTSPHPMTKGHTLTFVAYATGDQLLMAKLYPEWAMSFRFRRRGRGILYFHCSQHGLFRQNC